jgi:hypothetical protein
MTVSAAWGVGIGREGRDDPAADEADEPPAP